MYSEKIKLQISAAARRVDLPEPNASGRAVTFLCGVSVAFELKIDPEEKVVEGISFRTNGCGFTVAAAEFLAGQITGTKLVDLEGLDSLAQDLKMELGPAPDNRHHCFNMCLDALQNALSDFRKKQIAEWNGDEVLICTCFGVSENKIENLITREGLKSVEDVGSECNAGTGCGSCQPLIQEILDNLAL